MSVPFFFEGKFDPHREARVDELPAAALLVRPADDATAGNGWVSSLAQPASRVASATAGHTSNRVRAALVASMHRLRRPHHRLTQAARVSLAALACSIALMVPAGAAVAAPSADAPQLAAQASAAPATAQADAGLPDNVVPVTVRKPRHGYNRALVSVTVCVPGTDQCETIHDVLIDTGSVGLRLQRDAMRHPERFAAMPGPDGKPMAECLRFLSSNAWGPVARADVTLGGMTARAIPVQIVDEVGRVDASHPRPQGCQSQGHPTSNGTLGIAATRRTDCGEPCSLPVSAARYFTCDAGEACAPVVGALPASFRVAHPVAALPRDNNGVVLALDLPPANGIDAVSGSLTLGIDTRANNSLDARARVRLDNAGRFMTRFAGVDYPKSYFDTGTQDLYFSQAAAPIETCGRQWCASSEASPSATLVGNDGASVDVTVRVGDTAALERSGKGALRNVARVSAATSQAFVWGLPFFFGKRVFVGFADAPGRSDRRPFYAF
ncbi:DUF3443 family protein [Chitinasiproducens palmae]|uniref:Uncharacterized protein n=1 Tax=Chitinasiproducens palmae TaxID=1770053 RepID=A0A1H2PJA1_9BURK|nr:DUF3443 family protein [Chitinasiproducens palmae]SDV46420.1 Protein of unknown function [Chitinasiproducens palmae]